jgi:hypothetical protein
MWGGCSCFSAHYLERDLGALLGCCSACLLIQKFAHFLGLRKACKLAGAESILLQLSKDLPLSVLLYVFEGGFGCVGCVVRDFLEGNRLFA